MADRDEQTEHDARVEQIASAVPPKLVSGPFKYDRPFTLYWPKD